MVEPIEPAKRASDRCHAAGSEILQQRGAYAFFLINSVVCRRIAFCEPSSKTRRSLASGWPMPAEACDAADAEHGRCFCSSFLLSV